MRRAIIIAINKNQYTARAPEFGGSQFDRPVKFVRFLQLCRRHTQGLQHLRDKPWGNLQCNPANQHRNRFALSVSFNNRYNTDRIHALHPGE